MRKLLTFLISPVSKLSRLALALVSLFWLTGATWLPLFVQPAVTYQGPGDQITSGWYTWGSCAIVFNVASASTSTSMCDLVQGSTGASPGTAVGTLRGTAAGTVDLSAYFSGSVTPSAACAAITGGCVVSQQYDQSGNSHPLTQATTASMPALVFSGLNGLPVLNYPGGTKALGSAATSAAQPYTFTVVYFRATSGPVGGLIGANNTNAYIGASASANTANIVSGSTLTATANDNVWHSFHALDASGTSYINIDGTETSGSLVGANFSSSTINLGRTNAVQLTGSIAADGLLLATTTSTKRNAVCNIYKTMFALSGATC